MEKREPSLDGWMASPTQGMWVWVNSGRWWWTGRPGSLWFMGSQRVGHDRATELNWCMWHLFILYSMVKISKRSYLEIILMSWEIFTVFVWKTEGVFILFLNILLLKVLATLTYIGVYNGTNLIVTFLGLIFGRNPQNVSVCSFKCFMIAIW